GDLVLAKVIFQWIYGGPVFMLFERKGPLFTEYIFDRLKNAEETEIAKLTYPVPMMLLLFAVTVLYYCSFFLSGCFIMACIDSGRKKQAAYCLVTTLFGTLMYLPTEEWGSSPVQNIYGIFSAACCHIGRVSSPAVFSYWSFGTFYYNPIGYFIEAITFIIIIVMCIHYVTWDTGANDGKSTESLSGMYHVTGDTGTNYKNPKLSWENIRFRIKRFFGSLRLTILSSEYSAVFVIILWILVNFGYAVRLGSEIHGRRFSDFSLSYNCYKFFIQEIKLYSDIATPVILIAAAAVMIPRQTKLCAANSVSGRLRAVNGLLAGGVYSCALAAADIIFSKTIISDICGAMRYTFLEKYIYNRLTYDFDNNMGLISNGIMQLFAVTALYYLAVYMTAYFYGQCIYNRSKFVVYAITATVIAAALFGIGYLFDSLGNDAVSITAVFLMFICLFATPHLMLVMIIPQINYMDSEMSVTFLIGMCTVYIIAMLALSMAAEPEISGRSNRIKRN
ncbi:MAG: hypothetical protein K2N36_07095, partial [Ruminiclostridium sp.]|nr:hypothetical protein [Ruminiclostridium sp.]